MRTRLHVSLGAWPLVLFSVASALLPASLAAQEPAAVSVEDIGTKVVLVGRLGQPLGTMMDVQGTWKFPDRFDKDYSLRFLVSHVNGKALLKPVEFDWAQVKVISTNGENAIPKSDERKTLDGLAWTLRAYETGRFNRIPKDYWEEPGTRRDASPYWMTKTFTSELVGVLRSRSVER